LAGTCDENSPLHVLQEYGPSLVRKIYELGGPRWANHVTITIPATFVGTSLHGEPQPLVRYNKGWIESRAYECELLEDHSASSFGPQSFAAFAKCGMVEFPEPKDINT
jgi:hypothetical protein